MMGTALRPPELQLEGATIRTSYGTGGRVIEATGPHPPDPDWLLRPWMGGWTIVYEHRFGGPCWINEVFVEDGRIYAYPWRDKIEVVEAGVGQMRLF